MSLFPGITNQYDIIWVEIRTSGSELESMWTVDGWVSNGDCGQIITPKYLFRARCLSHATISGMFQINLMLMSDQI